VLSVVYTGFSFIEDAAKRDLISSSVMRISEWPGKKILPIARVPGSVGLLTIAILLYSTVESVKRSHQLTVEC